MISEYAMLVKYSCLLSGHIEEKILASYNLMYYTISKAGSSFFLPTVSELGITK